MIAAQLVEELAAAAVPWAGLLGVDLVAMLGERATQAAPRLAAQLADPQEGPDVALSLLDVLWHGGEPDAGWWQTPLGVAVAAAAAGSAQGTVTHRQAAQMLGVASGTIAQLAARGRARPGRGLPSGPPGIPRAAVLARIAERRRPSGQA